MHQFLWSFVKINANFVADINFPSAVAYCDVFFGFSGQVLPVKPNFVFPQKFISFFGLFFHVFGTAGLKNKPRIKKLLRWIDFGLFKALLKQIVVYFSLS